MIVLVSKHEYTDLNGYDICKYEVTHERREKNESGYSELKFRHFQYIGENNIPITVKKFISQCKYPIEKNIKKYIENRLTQVDITYYGKWGKLN